MHPNRGPWVSNFTFFKKFVKPFWPSKRLIFVDFMWILVSYFDFLLFLFHIFNFSIPNSEICHKKRDKAKQKCVFLWLSKYKPRAYFRGNPVCGTGSFVWKTRVWKNSRMNMLKGPYLVYFCNWRLWGRKPLKKLHKIILSCLWKKRKVTSWIILLSQQQQWDGCLSYKLCEKFHLILAITLIYIFLHRYYLDVTETILVSIGLAQ